MTVLAKINKLKRKLNDTNCIALVWDTDGSGDSDYIETVIYKDHNDETIYARNSENERCEIDETDFENVKHVMVVNKNFRRKLSQATDDKIPVSAKKHVGIELEFISKLSHVEIVMAMVEAGVEKHVTVKDDGSIDTTDAYPFSHEIAILATEDNYKRVISRICKALKGNSTVNKSCGMHVHIDMRMRNPDMSYAALFEAQPVLYAMCPESRRTGTYSQPELNFKSITGNAMGDRYFGINKSAYDSHKTIEVRIHSGTLVTDKVNNWIALLLKIVNGSNTYNLRNVKLLRSLKEFKKRAKLRGKLANYVDNRIVSFKDDHRNSGFELVA